MMGQFNISFPGSSILRKKLIIQSCDIRVRRTAIWWSNTDASGNNDERAVTDRILSVDSPSVFLDTCQRPSFRGKGSDNSLFYWL